MSVQGQVGTFYRGNLLPIDLGNPRINPEPRNPRQDIISLDWIGLDWMQYIITLDSPTLDSIKKFLSRESVSWFQKQLMVTGENWKY